MDFNRLGSFTGASYRGKSIIHDVIGTEANKAFSRLKYLVGETENSFSKECLIQPSPAAFDEVWKEKTRVSGGTAWGCILGLGVILALAILSGLTFCSSLGIWDDGYGNWYMNLICAGAFGLLTLGFMLAFVYTAFGAAQMLSRGFADTWQLRVLAGRAWYIGDRALHIARDGWGSISSTTIFYEAIGTVLLEGNAVVVRGRDGAMLASIPDPSGCGMDAKEIVAHLKGLVAGATSA